ncbi:hypothetical protein D3C81_1984520 [compost metagenome]
MGRPILCWAMAEVCGSPSPSPFWVTTMSAWTSSRRSSGFFASRLRTAAAHRSEVSSPASFTDSVAVPILASTKASSRSKEAAWAMLSIRPAGI